MQSLGKGFFSNPKRAFLIKLASVLGFGGMVGFCILGCEKQAPVGKDVVQDSEQAKVEANAQGNASDSALAAQDVEVLIPSAGGELKALDSDLDLADEKDINVRADGTIEGPDLVNVPKIEIVEEVLPPVNAVRPDRVTAKKYGPPPDRERKVSRRK